MSKIEVNEIDAQCGSTVTVGSAGKTVAVPGNVVKTNAVQASDGGNIVNQCGTTITLGASGDTVSLASGASQTGFGRTGTVDWQTGSIKTATFTAANGEGYFCNTSGGAFTVNLPAGSAGAIVSVSDYTRTFQTNNLTVSPNGSEKIGGIAEDAILSTEGQSATFVYVDSTEGWINVQETSNSVTGANPFVVATGGTITTCGNCKIHTFTGPGTFCVSQIAGVCAPTRNNVSYMVVAGGGGGGRGSSNGAGAGAGGFREFKAPLTPYTASPKDGNPGGTSITVTETSFPITVGGGGTGGPVGGTGNSGSNSVFSTVTSAGGGGGGSYNANNGGSGGSGGGAGGPGGTSGNGNTPPVTPPQGFSGGATPTGGPQAGGGGATAVGTSGNPSPNNTAGPGGNGATSSINGTPTARAGGGGGGYDSGPSAGAGGTGGGGNGSTNNAPGGPGSTNTGGGAGGNGPINGLGGTGGSGIVIIRYKFQ